jgi:hypothetical protein
VSRILVEAKVCWFVHQFVAGNQARTLLYCLVERGQTVRKSAGGQVSPGSMSFQISQGPSCSGLYQNRQPSPSLAASGQAHFADKTAMRQCNARHRCFIFESRQKRLKMDEI